MAQGRISNKNYVRDMNIKDAMELQHIDLIIIYFNDQKVSYSKIHQ